MRNKELYQATFSQVRPSSDIRWEDLMAKKRKRRRRRPLLLAAAVVGVLAALTCAAVAVNFMGLGDLLLPGRQSGQSSPGGQEERVLSLSGYMDTPESQALAEWETFRSDYDPTGSILAAGKQGIDVACGDGLVLRILELQAPGSRRMPAADFLRGHPLEGIRK